MTDHEREEYRIAESHNSLATEQAVTMMLRVRFPTILCITISSLLNTTKPGGLFHNTLCDCRIIIGDIKALIDLTMTPPYEIGHNQVQMQLELAAISLQTQKNLATTLVKQWNHHKSEQAFLCASAGEQMCLTTQCLRRAEVTEERILRMGTRYMIMSLLYEYIMELNDESESQKKEFLTRKREYPFGTDEIKELVISQRDLLNTEIEDMKELLESREREVKSLIPTTSFQVQRILEKKLESFQDQLAFSRLELENLSKAVEAQKLEMAELGKELEVKKKLVSVEEYMGKNVELRVEVAPVRVQEKGEESEAGGLVDD
ncbi:hypothetical protein V3C99_002131 [Haemonchus contortus]|nr:unnamed protein product [Haemonchus contortus]